MTGRWLYRINRVSPLLILTSHEHLTPFHTTNLLSVVFEELCCSGLKTSSKIAHIGQCLSGVVNLLSGVVQGNGVGPMMFLIFIDDLQSYLRVHGVTAKLFADDVNVYLIITTVDDVAKLQGANKCLGKRLAVTSVCKQVQFVEYYIGHVPFDVTYHINGSSLSYQLKCRDLGVIVTHDLSPSTHISEIVAKAHSVLILY